MRLRREQRPSPAPRAGSGCKDVSKRASAHTRTINPQGWQLPGRGSRIEKPRILLTGGQGCQRRPIGGECQTLLTTCSPTRQEEAAEMTGWPARSIVINARRPPGSARLRTPGHPPRLRSEPASPGKSLCQGISQIQICWQATESQRNDRGGCQRGAMGAAGKQTVP